MPVQRLWLLVGAVVAEKPCDISDLAKLAATPPQLHVLQVLPRRVPATRLEEDIGSDGRTRHGNHVVEQQQLAERFAIVAVAPRETATGYGRPLVGDLPEAAVDQGGAAPCRAPNRLLRPRRLNTLLV